MSPSCFSRGSGHEMLTLDRPTFPAKRRRCVSVVEYGLLIGLLSLVAVVSVVTVAQYINGAFGKVHEGLAQGGIPER